MGRMRALHRPLVALGLLFWSAVGAAAPSYLRLSYTDDTESSMTVTWNTTVSTGTEVMLGTSPGSYTQTIAGTSFQANTGLGYVHEATLTGLTPSTVYYYIAGNSADGYSSEASFTTGPTEDPSCGKLRFTFVADNRPDPIFGGGENWPQILGQAAQHKPAFVLNGGDMVVDGDQIGEWLTFLGYTSPVAKSIPFMSCIGNHDNGPGQGDGANYNQLFASPVSTGANGSNTEDYYFFTYGNAIFVSLSTETFSAGSSPFATQAAWLDEVLTQNPKKWKFVYYHKPSYTTEAPFSISHEPNEAGQNAALVPIIDKHHVDIVFTSHNHWYERFHPTNCATKGSPGSDTACTEGPTGFATGTVYIVSGGAGAFTIPAFLCGNTPGRASCSGDHHYVLVDIDNETLKLETWGAAPQPNVVIDTFSITKTADPGCEAEVDGGVAGAAGASGGGGSAGSGVAGAGTDAGLGGSGGSANGGTGPDAASAGSPATGGTSGGGSKADSGDDGGCGCRTQGSTSRAGLVLSLLGLAGALRRRANRRR
jgi:MYXO-CTERM domain-containing protein